MNSFISFIASLLPQEKKGKKKHSHGSLINRALVEQGNRLTNHYNTGLEKSGSSLFLINRPLPLFYFLSWCFQKTFWLRFLIISAGSDIFHIVL